MQAEVRFLWLVDGELCWVYYEVLRGEDDGQLHFVRFLRKERLGGGSTSGGGPVDNGNTGSSSGGSGGSTSTVYNNNTTQPSTSTQIGTMWSCNALDNGNRNDGSGRNIHLGGYFGFIEEQITIQNMVNETLKRDKVFHFSIGRILGIPSLNSMVNHASTLSKAAGKTVHAGFYSDKDLPKGTAFYWGNKINFTIKIKKEQFFLNTRRPIQYNALIGEHGLFGNPDTELRDQTLERAYWHEWGHWYHSLLDPNYFSLDDMEKENFSVFIENIAGMLFNTPIRYTYRKSTDLYILIYGSDIDVFSNPLKKYVK